MKTRTLLVLALSALVLATFSSAQTSKAAKQPSPRIINLMPAFWDYWAKAEHLDEAAQIKLFREMLIDRYPDVYTAEVLTMAPDKPFDEQLAKRFPRWKQRVVPKMEGVKRVSDSITRDLPRYQASFQKTFPDFAYNGDIYFMCSLGGFDGGTRKINGRTMLLFGVDMIASVYGDTINPEPFFHHELFHVYQLQFLGEEEDTVIDNLWREGLAVYVAQTLNPMATGIAVFGLPEDTPARARTMLPKLAHDLRARLDSKSKEDVWRYFMGSNNDPSVPPRSGYYIGYLVAEKLAKNHKLFDLAHLTPAQLRPEIETALSEIEAGK